MLRTDPEKGISASEVEGRKAAFGENKFPEPPFESWISLFLECFKDAILIILIIAAIVSVIIGSIPSISDVSSTFLNRLLD